MGLILQKERVYTAIKNITKKRGIIKKMEINHKMATLRQLKRMMMNCQADLTYLTRKIRLQLEDELLNLSLLRMKILLKMVMEDLHIVAHYQLAILEIR